MKLTILRPIINQKDDFLKITIGVFYIKEYNFAKIQAVINNVLKPDRAIILK